MIDFNILSFYLAEPVSVFVVALLFFPDVSPIPQKLSTSSILGCLNLNGLFPSSL